MRESMHNHDEHDDRSHPEALSRHHGHPAGRRQRGLYHQHRHRGWQPHPHEHAARRRAEERVPVAVEGGTGLEAARTPLHHHQHRVSARHMALPRGTLPVAEAGTVASYDAASGTAMVRMAGAPARLIGPARVTACAPRDFLIAGAACLVVLLDPHNPADAVVAALWPEAGASGGAKLTQAGVVTVDVAGASVARVAVACATPYAAAPVVVATSTDSAWTAAVGEITAAGFTLTVSAGAPATGTVAVQWMACGV